MTFKKSFNNFLIQLFSYSLDTDEENALNKNNLTSDPVKSHKKRKKQKDKKNVSYIIFDVVLNIFKSCKL